MVAHLRHTIRMSLIGNVPPVSAGHCLHGYAQGEGGRFLTLRRVSKSIKHTPNSHLERDDLRRARRVLSRVTHRYGVPWWEEDAFSSASDAAAVGRLIEALLLDGQLQGEILRYVIAQSCASEQRLISINNDPHFGSREIQQPPIEDGRLSQAAAAKVEPWLNMAEFLQTCNGVRKTYRITTSQAGLRPVPCNCEQHPERYIWRRNVAKLHPLARPFFGLDEQS